MRTVDYIELRAKALVSELSQAWDFEKRRELCEVLNDLEGAEEKETNELPIKEFFKEANEFQQKPKRSRRSFPRKPRGFRRQFILAVLKFIKEKEYEGYLEGDLYAEQFGLDFPYFSQKFCPYINKEIQKRSLFPGYRIGFTTHDDHVHYVLMKNEADHAID